MAYLANLGAWDLQVLLALAMATPPYSTMPYSLRDTMPHSLPCCPMFELKITIGFFETLSLAYSAILGGSKKIWVGGHLTG